MADQATAVNDEATQEAPVAPAPAATQDAPVEDMDTFDLDASDFAEDTSDEESTDDANTEDASTDDESPEATDTADDTTEAPTDEADKPTKADERKQQLNNEIRDLVSQRNELRKQVEAENARVYQPQSVDDLVAEGHSEADAKIEALRQQIEMKDYNDRVAEAQLVVNSEAQRVLQDFPRFNPQSDSYNKDLGEAAASMLDQNFIRDENTAQRDQAGNPIPGTGQILGTHISTYQLYKLIDDAVAVGATQGEQQGQQAVKRMMASADSIGSAGPKAPAKDAFLEGFGTD